MSPVVVIGAGLAGLSAACYLVGRGYDVTVVEREELPAVGPATRQDGFTFDTGPTVLTMPDLVADAIRVATGIRVLPSSSAADAAAGPGLPGAVRRRQHDPRPFGREAMRDEIARTCGSLDAAAFDGFVDWLRRALRDRDAALHRPQLRLAARPAVPPAGRSPARRLGAFGRLGTAVRKRFADHRLHRLFSFQAMYAGLAPDERWPSTP